MVKVTKKQKSEHERVYFTAQSSILKRLISGESMSSFVVAYWNASSLFVSEDRASFVIVPNDFYFLTELLISHVSDLWPGSKCQFVREQFGILVDGGPLFPANLSGSSKISNGPLRKQLVEVTSHYLSDPLWIDLSLMDRFPKDASLFVSGNPNSPILFKSSLGVLLGGVFPVKISVQSDM